MTTAPHLAVDTGSFSTFHLTGESPRKALMTEPISHTAGGIAAYKLGAAILGVSVVAAALGLMVLMPRTPREAAVRILATMVGSALLGPLAVAAVHAHWPEIFLSGIKLAEMLHMESWLGLFVTAAPIMAISGLPFWWLLGALVRWFDKRRDKDLGELARDAANDASGAVFDSLIRRAKRASPPADPAPTIERKPEVLP